MEEEKILQLMTRTLLRDIATNDQNERCSNRKFNFMMSYLLGL